MCDLAVLHLTDFLSANVVDEFRGRFHSHLCLYLLDKCIGVDLSSVESFEHIIKSPCSTIIELSLIIYNISDYLA